MLVLEKSPRRETWFNWGSTLLSTSSSAAHGHGSGVFHPDVPHTHMPDAMTWGRVATASLRDCGQHEFGANSPKRHGVDGCIMCS